MKWFLGGKLNVSYNCVDRHVEAGRGDKVAYHWEGEPDGDRRDDHLRRPAARGGRVRERPQAARRREGHRRRDLHGHGPGAAGRHARLHAARCAAHRRLRRLLGRLALGAHQRHGLRGADHAGRGLAPRHDRAAEGDRRRGARGHAGSKASIVVRRTGNDVPMQGGPRPLVRRRRGSDDPASCPPEPMDAEDLLFLMYTSGTTAKPKGIAHTTGGYLVGAATTHYYVFDLKPETDVYWCAADIGWITGHSYIVYGPLCNGTTSVLYEGTPDFPDKDRWWSIVERYGVTILYTAPTAIRTHMKWGPGARPAARPLVAAPARLGRRADQPRGVGLVPRAHRRQPLPDRRHLVADRDGDDPDHAASGRDDDEARLGDEAVPGHRRRDLQRGRRGGRARAAGAISC